MEWMNRGNGQGQPAGTAPHQAAAPAQTQGTRVSKANLKSLRGLRLAQVILLFLVTILIVAVTWFVALGGSSRSEAGLVDGKKLQAVFLNGGQVYFGNITDLNGKFLSMKNIYYLRVNQQVQPNQSNSTAANDISLVKLGCELHGPTDSMVINREQIIFWENLKDDGQVAKAVKSYKEQNPGDQKCEQASSSQSTTNDTTAQQQTDTTTNKTTTTTPTTTNNSSTTKKP